LVQDLRKLADLETYPIEPEAINLTELLQAVIIAVRDASDQQERPVSVIAPQTPWPPTPVKGDSDLLTLAFYNLLNNAFKYTPPRNGIEILIREDSTTVTVDVADSGSGIGEVDLPHIFEELYRGENAGPVEGSGLGLALAKQVVEGHNGKITVRSRIGQGTIFTAGGGRTHHALPQWLD
jgi:two-component system OmpR family sensor kinase